MLFAWKRKEGRSQSKLKIENQSTILYLHTKVNLYKLILHRDKFEGTKLA